MTRAIILIPLLAVVISATSIEIGNQEFPYTKPFCADWTLSLRYQVVVLQEEIGTPMEITSLSWDPSDPTHTVTFDEITIYMGLCSTDELGTDFEANYVPGTKTQVFHAVNPTWFAGTSWLTIDLDTPFWYDGTHNLIIDVEWPDGYGQI
jgi:hypothetical protein